MALAFARRGDRAYATMRGVDGKNRESADALRSTAEAEGIDVRVLELDVTSQASVDAAATTVLAESGAPYAVINNAGQMYVGIAEAFSAEEVARQFDVNVVGLHRVTRAFLPSMREAGAGVVINISSVAGRIAVPFFAVYNGSKFAVEGYSMGLRAELASSGVDVVVIQPGPFTTELFPRSPTPADADRAASYPQVLHDAFEGMNAGFEEAFESDEINTDPVLVVDQTVELVDLAPGTRPFRSVVGWDFGVVRDLNAAAEPFERQILVNFGLDEVGSIRPS